MVALTGTLLFVIVVATTVMMIHTVGRQHLYRDGQNPSQRLPLPCTKGGMPVAEALAGRRSVRAFARRSLTAEQIAQLCWAAQGITDGGQGLRTAPSAGALFPLLVFLVDGNGVHEYEPQGHTLRRVVDGDFRQDLQAAALDQPCVGTAPLCMVLAMDLARSAAKYQARAERYCLLEAGHVAQSVLLQATALGLGGVTVGAFNDRTVSALLHLPQGLRAVYLLPLGYPAGQ